MCEIKYLIDLEGFCVEGQFIVKEMAYLNRDDRTVHHAFYRVGEAKRLTEKDRRQAGYVTKRVHGLAFGDSDDDRSQGQLRSDVMRLCRAADNEHRTIGYKGGNYELDLLTELGYRHIAFNIEYYGCDPFNRIVTQHPDWYEAASTEGCGRHATLVTQKAAHCPRVELICFDRWLRHFAHV